MGIDTVLKIGENALAKVSKWASCGSMRELRTLESLGLKMKSSTNMTDTMLFGNVKKLKDYVSIKADDFVAVYPNKFKTNYRHISSKPAKSFEPYINEKVLEKGISTKPNIGNVSLKGGFDQPIATSGVGDCAVIFMYNSKKSTHSLYHSYNSTGVDEISSKISELMPEGFDRIIIVPGSNPRTAETASNLFAAAKNINENAIVEFKHSEIMLEQAKRYQDITGAPWTVEFISYGGDVYAMPIYKEYKPLFKVINK